jgi:ATP synthase I subunit
MSDAASNAINLRIFRSMAIATGVSVAVSAAIGPWRVTTGLLVGGLLALFSHRWLKQSAAAVVGMSIGGAAPRLRLAQFLLRYVVIGAMVFSLYQLDLLSLTATLAGMSTFVVAIFVEAIREFYFAIIQREEIS